MDNGDKGSYSFFIGWSIVFILFWAGLKYEGTRTIIYYALWLSLILLIITHADALTNLLKGTGLNTENPEQIDSNQVNFINSNTRGKL